MINFNHLKEVPFWQGPTDNENKVLMLESIRDYHRLHGPKEQ